MFNQCLLNEQKLKVNSILIILISNISNKDVEWYYCVKIIESQRQSWLASSFLLKLYTYMK